jgi:hypothetical protein
MGLSNCALKPLHSCHSVEKGGIIGRDFILWNTTLMQMLVILNEKFLLTLTLSFLVQFLFTRPDIIPDFFNLVLKQLITVHLELLCFIIFYTKTLLLLQKPTEGLSKCTCVSG